MAKKIVAVTGIKHTKGFVAAGEPLNPADFTKEELRELHDNGAVMVVDSSTTDEVKAEDITPEQLGTENVQTQDVSAAAKQNVADTVNKANDEKTETATPTKTTPAKK